MSTAPQSDAVVEEEKIEVTVMCGTASVKVSLPKENAVVASVFAAAASEFGIALDVKAGQVADRSVTIISDGAAQAVDDAETAPLADKDQVVIGNRHKNN